jgi:hypothetical protein
MIVMWRYRKREEVDLCNGSYALSKGYISRTKNSLDISYTGYIVCGKCERNLKFRRHEDGGF